MRIGYDNLAGERMLAKSCLICRENRLSAAVQSNLNYCIKEQAKGPLAILKVGEELLAATRNTIAGNTPGVINYQYIKYKPENPIDFEVDISEAEWDKYPWSPGPTEDSPTQPNEARVLATSLKRPIIIYDLIKGESTEAE